MGRRQNRASLGRRRARGRFRFLALLAHTTRTAEVGAFQITRPKKLQQSTTNSQHVECREFEVLAHDAGSHQCTGGSQRHAPLVNVGNMDAAAHSKEEHSSLRAASARKVGQLPLLVLGLELAIPAAFQQHEHLRADYEENAEGGLSRRHGHSVLNLTLIVYDLCVLEVPTAQLAVGGWAGRFVLARGPLHRAHSVPRVGGMNCYCWCSMSFGFVTVLVESSVA